MSNEAVAEARWAHPNDDITESIPRVRVVATRFRMYRRLRARLALLMPKTTNSQRQARSVNRPCGEMLAEKSGAASHEELVGNMCPPSGRQSGQPPPLPPWPIPCYPIPATHSKGPAYRPIPPQGSSISRGRCADSPPGSTHRRKPRSDHAPSTGLTHSIFDFTN